MPNNQEPRGMLLLPAYGKRHSTLEECLADWDAGKDFKIYGGPYCSIRNVDAIRADGFQVLLFAWGNPALTETYKMEI